MRLSIIETELQSRRLLAVWQVRFGLGYMQGELEAISPMQVTGEDGKPGAELVGVIRESATRFTIAHTRPLAEDDIVHELLHVVRPEWGHEEVETWTNRLVLEPSFAVAVARGTRFTVSATEAEEDSQMPEYKAFNLRTRQECTILNPEIVTMKNGRKAVQGIASDDGKTKVFRILGAAEAKSA